MTEAIVEMHPPSRPLIVLLEAAHFANLWTSICAGNKEHKLVRERNTVNVSKWGKYI